MLTRWLDRALAVPDGRDRADRRRTDRRGIRLWDDLRGLEDGYGVVAETAESGTVHLTFRR
jgi:hypothetical protein